MQEDAIVTDDAVSDAAPVDSSASAPDAPQSDSSPASTSPAADSPAKPGDAQRSADSGSLTANADAPNTPASKPQIPPGYVRQQDLDNLKRTLAQRQTELQRHQSQLQQYQGIDPRTIAEFRKQQEEAKASKLPMWSAKHPEHGQFSDLKARWQQANQTYQRLAHGKTPEEQEQIRANVLADFSPQQQQVMREHAQHQRRFSERMAEDPEGTLAELIESRVGNMLSQREQQAHQRHSAEQSVGTWFQDQANSPVVDTQRDWMIQSLEAGVPWTIVRLEAENRHLRSQVGASTAKALSAEERSRLAKGNAAITRDPVTAPVITDSYEYAVKTAREKGIEVGGPRWLEHIVSLNLKD
jgi:hypothetical protein